jgi:hypothetical protein
MFYKMAAAKSHLNNKKIFDGRMVNEATAIQMLPFRKAD